MVWFFCQVQAHLFLGRNLELTVKMLYFTRKILHMWPKVVPWFQICNVAGMNQVCARSHAEIMPSEDWKLFAPNPLLFDKTLLQRGLFQKPHASIASLLPRFGPPHNSWSTCTKSQTLCSFHCRCWSRSSSPLGNARCVREYGASLRRRNTSVCARHHFRGTNNFANHGIFDLTMLFFALYVYVHVCLAQIDSVIDCFGKQITLNSSVPNEAVRYSWSWEALMGRSRRPTTSSRQFIWKKKVMIVHWCAF